MAGVAIHAAETWRRQKKNEIALDIYQYILELNDVTFQVVCTLQNGISRKELPLYFDFIHGDIEKDLDRLKDSTKFQNLAHLVLKEDELAKKMILLRMKLRQMSMALTTLKSGHKFSTALISKNPKHMAAANDITKIYDELIVRKELEKFLDFSEERLKRFF